MTRKKITKSQLKDRRKTLRRELREIEAEIEDLKDSDEDEDEDEKDKKDKDKDEDRRSQERSPRSEHWSRRRLGGRRKEGDS